MNLKDTVGRMQSKNYKDRFKAEYFQLKIRYESLLDILEKADKGTLPYKLTCPRSIYNEQLRGMKIYMNVLEDRAIYEDIDLNEEV